MEPPNKLWRRFGPVAAGHGLSTGSGRIPAVLHRPHCFRWQTVDRSGNRNLFPHPAALLSATNYLLKKTMIVVKDERDEVSWARCSRSPASSSAATPCRSSSNVLLTQGRPGSIPRHATSRSRSPRAPRSRAAAEGSVTVGRAQADRHPALAARGRRGGAASAKDKRMVLRAGKSRFTLQTLPADDFPRMVAGGGRLARPLTLPQKALKDAAAAGAVRHGDAGHPLLPERHALLRGRGACCTLVATDGHRLALRPGELDTDSRAAGGDPAAQDRARAAASCWPTPTSPVAIEIVRQPGALQLRRHGVRLQARRGQVPRLHSA